MTENIAGLSEHPHGMDTEGAISVKEHYQVRQDHEQNVRLVFDSPDFKKVKNVTPSQLEDTNIPQVVSVKA